MHASRSRSRIEFISSRSEKGLLLLKQLLLRQPALIHLTRLPLPRLQHLLRVPCTSQHLFHILGKSQLLQRLIDVFNRDCLLLLLLRDLVGFGGDEGDEFNTAFCEEVTGLFGECNGPPGRR